MIHKTAIVDLKAKISDNVKIGPYCFIGPEVEIGNNSIIHSHVNIVGNTKIGENNQIYPFSSIGTPPQDLKYKGEKNSIVIGNNNKFREYVNINPGTKQGGGITRIGDNNLLMVYCHVAHDCMISNNVVLANNVQVGGHVTIQNNAIVGGSCAIHQFSRIGEYAMIGGMTGVLSDVIPFGLSMGNRNNLMGLNLIGLRRSKVSNENIKKIQLAYEIIFKTPSFRENIEQLNNDLKENEFVKKILGFINTDKKRPISLPSNK
ncbi:MAG: acyl-ACP--UDP-N-acetylglucosamine O-acyltransferase [Candidatus Pelagibacter sp.]